MAGQARPDRRRERRRHAYGRLRDDPDDLREPVRRLAATHGLTAQTPEGDIPCPSSIPRHHR